MAPASSAATVSGYGNVTMAGRRARPLTADLRETGAKVGLGALMLVLAIRLWGDYRATGHITGLLLLASELLVVVLTIIRRPASIVDRSWQARAIAGLSILGPPLVRPIAGAELVPDPYTAALSMCGLALLIGGKLSLGRSFGLMPANRGIVCSGVYRVVRHPIYAGYLITHLGFLAAHPSPRNIFLLVAADTALMVRAAYEERTLVHDESYAAYCARVRWRVLPGLF